MNVSTKTQRKNCLRSISLAHKNKVEKEIGHFVNNKILITLKYSVWAHCFILKSDNKVRICDEFKIKIIPVLGDNIINIINIIKYVLPKNCTYIYNKL